MSTSTQSWYHGEFAFARGLITFVLIIIIFWFLIQCAHNIQIIYKKLRKYCCYKTAKIEPIPEAITTIEPVNSYAKDISLQNITIIN